MSFLQCLTYALKSSSTKIEVKPKLIFSRPLYGPSKTVGGIRNPSSKSKRRKEETFLGLDGEMWAAVGVTGLTIGPIIYHSIRNYKAEKEARKQLDILIKRVENELAGTNGMTGLQQKQRALLSNTQEVNRRPVQYQPATQKRTYSRDDEEEDVFPPVIDFSQIL